MSYRMIHAARRLMCDKFSILCTISELNAKQTKEEAELTKSSDKLEAALKRVAKQYDFSNEKWDDDYSLRQAEIKQLYELLAKNAKEDCEMRIRIKKVRDDIPTPGYSHKADAGFDLIAATDVVIQPGETAKIPTGLSFEIAEGYELQLRPRSGITAKTPLRVQLGTIDASYRGEISVIMDNVSNDDWSNMARRIDNSYVHETIDKYRPGTYLLRKGDRICQGVIAPVAQATFEVADELSETSRGEGGFGHTGVKS